MAIRKGAREFVPQASGRIGGRVLAGLVLWTSALVLSSAPLWAAQDNGVRTSLSETEEIGKKLFFQRCSFCHLGMPTKYQTYGPLLHREVIADRGDKAVREKIMDGSIAMPGFKYSLKPGDIDSIVAYLKTVKREDVVHKSSKQ